MKVPAEHCGDLEQRMSDVPKSLVHDEVAVALFSGASSSTLSSKLLLSTRCNSGFELLVIMLSVCKERRGVSEENVNLKAIDARF